MRLRMEWTVISPPGGGGVREAAEGYLIVGRQHGAAQAELVVVGQPDGFRLCYKRGTRQHRPKHLRSNSPLPPRLFIGLV